MITQLLLLVSIFSLVFSYSSSLFSSPLVIYPHILIRMMNKSCVFLICNMLLFFVAKASGSDLSGFDPYNDMPHRVLDVVAAADDDVAIESELALLEKGVVFDESREKENNEDTSGKTKEISILVAETDVDDDIRDDESEASKRCRLFEEEEEEEDYDDETRILSTEELNWKIEDFIRRMKAEIRVSEAR
ncbi:hypothetical protein OROGR_012464 [Orobanche gracilis]